MSLEPRRKPYIWPTWISPLLAGDKHCEWAAWVRAHYFYDKRETVGRENALSQWKGEHARLVAARAAVLEEAGWSVRLEDQNRFTYRGQAADVGGCPDIVATLDGVAKIEDGKTGKPRDSDFWQTAIYGVLLPMIDETISELITIATVVYKDRTRPVTAQQILEARPTIIDQIKRTASPTEPARRPSGSECAFCDVGDCPERILDNDGLVADGDAF